MTWATSVPILVFLDLSILDIGPMYASDRQTDVRQTDKRQTDVRQTDVRQHHPLIPPPRSRGIIIRSGLYSMPLRHLKEHTKTTTMAYGNISCRKCLLVNILLLSMLFINKNLCGRDGRTICGPQRVPKSRCVSL